MVRTVCFDYCKVCRKHVEVYRVRLDYHQACIGLVGLESPFWLQQRV